MASPLHNANEKSKFSLVNAKDWVKKTLAEVQPACIRFWLSLRAKSFQVKPDVRRAFFVIVAAALLAIFVFFIHKYYSDIENYLISINVDSQGNSTGFFPTFFIILGSAILAVLAITFSLSLFGIQQAADKYTPTVLRNLLRDPISRSIFWIIAGISLAFFTFAFLPLNHLLLYEVVLSLIFLIGIFYLLRKQYTHITQLIDPVVQVGLHHNRGIRLLQTIDKHLDLMIKAKVIRPGPSEHIETKTKAHLRDRLRGGAIMKLPNLFDGVKLNLDEIYAIIRTFQNRKDYQVTKTGLYEVYSLVYKYIDVKSGTFFPSSWIGSLDYSHDDFLTEVFEKLKSIQSLATREKDFEISEQILDSSYKIAMKCTEIHYMTNPMNEYIHCMLATGYMQKNIENCLDAGMDDIGMQGSDRLGDIGLALIKKGDQGDILVILNYLSKIAMYGIIKQNASYLIAHPMRAFSVLLRAVLFTEYVDHRMLCKSILQKSANIIGTYVELAQKGTISAMVNVSSSIGDFVDLSKRTAMPLIFMEVYRKIEDEKTDPEKRKNLVDKTLDFAGEIWRFYDHISKYAAKKESFLIHYIDYNLYRISMLLLALYKTRHFDEHQKKELLNHIRWIISDYWRIYDYHVKITSMHHVEILDHLLEIGSGFHDLSLPEKLQDVISIIVNIAKSFLHKAQNRNGREAINVIQKAAYLCILCDSAEVYAHFVKEIKKDFWPEYCKRYPKDKTVLLAELIKIDPDRLRWSRSRYLFEDKLLSGFKKEEIIEFVKKLSGQLE